MEFAKNRLKFLKYIGLMPVTIVNGKSVTKPTDVIILMCSISFGIFISYVYFVRREELSTSKSDIANVGNFVSFVASIWVSIATMIVSLVYRHRIWQNVLNLELIEDKVRFSDIENLI